MTEAEAKQELGLALDARDVFHGAELRRFGQAVYQRQELKALIKSAEEDIKALDLRISKALADNNCHSCIHDHYKVTLAQGAHSTLDKMKLLEAGVAASVIAECTTKKAFNYVLVTDTEQKR